jgi:hypothetical protein
MTYTLIIQSIALPIGFVACLIGVLAVLYPKFMSKGFGVPTEGTAVAYVVGLGIRDFFIGATVLVLYSTNSWIILGYISFLIAVVAVSDFIVVYRYGDKKTSLVHLAGALVAAAYGCAIFSS